MKKLNGCQKGITLVEVLAVLAIGSIFMLMAIGIYVSVQDQYDRQSKEANSLVDVTYAMKVITKEVRQNPNNVVVYSPTNIKIGDKEYSYINNSIHRNGNLFVQNIETFYVELTDNLLKLQIKNASGKKVVTELVLRGGVEGESS